MPIYSYTVASDTLNGVVDSSELHKEIIASGLPDFEGVHREDGTIGIEFTSALDATQQTSLTTLVGAHEGVSKIVKRTCENCNNFSAIS